MTDGAGRSTASGRIRIAGALAWTVGAVVIAIVAFNAIAPLRLVDGGLIPPGVANEYPWEVDDPPVATIAADGTITGPAGGSVLRIPAAERPDGPLLLANTDDDNMVFLSVTGPDDVDFDADAGQRDWPEYVGYVEPGGVPIVQAGDLELWFRADEPLEFTLAPLTTEPLVDMASGTGDAYLLYDGDGIAARGIHRGRGIFFVTVFATGDRSNPIIESGEVDMRFSWPDTDDPVVIWVRAGDEGAWSIQVLDGTVPAPSTTPTAPTPEPTTSAETEE